MKLERAQELYSDYAEGVLSPALTQALEQHFDADPAAQDDYARFRRVYVLLEQPFAEELEVPAGFRAHILERRRAGTSAAATPRCPDAPPGRSPAGLRLSRAAAL